MIPSLPEELVRIILPKLPVNSLLRFDWVSKSWNSLIKDPYFIKQQLNQTLEDNNFSLMLDLVNTQDYMYSIEPNITASTNNVVLDPLPQLRDTDLKSPLDTFTISGSCNGLLLITDEHFNSGLELWNPSTRDYMQMPPYSNGHADHANRWIPHRDTYVLGYDLNKDDYKVIGIHDYVGIHYFVNLNPESGWLREVTIYSLQSHTRRKVQVDIPCPLLYGNGKYVNGAIYWIGGYLESDTPAGELSFDFGSEECKEISMPDDCEIRIEAMLPVVNLVEWKGCLCMYCGVSVSNADIYVMKEKLWCKLCTISSEAGPGLDGFDFLKGRCVCFTNNGKILLQNTEKSSHLLLYDTEIHSAEKLVIHGVPHKFVSEIFFGNTHEKPS